VLLVGFIIRIYTMHGPQNVKFVLGVWHHRRELGIRKLTVIIKKKIQYLILILSEASRVRKDF